MSSVADAVVSGLVVLLLTGFAYGIIANAWHEATGNWPRGHTPYPAHRAAIRKTIEGSERERELHQALAEWQTAIDHEEQDAKAAAVRRARIASRRWQ